MTMGFSKFVADKESGSKVRETKESTALAEHEE